MDDVQIILSASWVALMLTYLWGDVLRIYAGDFTEGEMGGKKTTQNMLLGIAVLMLITGSRKWTEVVMVSIGATLGIYFFFQKISPQKNLCL